MLTAVGEAGRLHAHPMTPQEVADDGTTWFFISRGSGQAANIGQQKRVNLAFADGSTWLSVAGHGQLVDDRARVDELWNPVVEAWFPDGKDSPDVALLRVDPDSAEYWDSPGGRVASALAFVKAKVAGERPTGDNEAVEMD